MTYSNSGSIFKNASFFTGPRRKSAARFSRAACLTFAVLPAAAFLSRSALAVDTWNPGGVGDGVTWDTAQLNWNTGATAFTQGDAVSFTDANSGKYAITLGGNITTSGITASNTAAAYNITIGSGLILTDTGAVLIAQSAVNAVTAVNLIGGGTYDQTGGNLTLGITNSFGAPGPRSVLDASALSSFIYNNAAGSILLGNGTRAQGCFTLATGALSSNTLTAATISLGNSGSANNNETSTMTLGSGSNLLQANTFTIGAGKGVGVINATAGGTVTIAGTAGGTSNANITIGSAGGGTVSTGSSVLNLLGANATVHAGTVIAGQFLSASAASATGNLSFDTGTFTIATSLQIAQDANTGVDTSGIKGNVVIGSNAASTGTLNVSGNFIIGNGISAQATARTDTATFTINGGTVNSNVDIISNNNLPSFVTMNSTLALLGGTLEMNGHQIGHANGNNTHLTTVTLPAAGKTATLSDLGGAGINDAGITMNGNGILILAGNNSYSGATSNTTVSSGALDVKGAISSATNNVSVAGGTLLGSGNISSTVSINGGNISGGDALLGSTGTLNLNNGLTLNSGNIVANVGTTSASAINVTSGPVIFNGGSLVFNLVGAPANNSVFNILTSSSALSAGSLSLSPFTAGRATITPAIVGNNLQVTVTGGPGNLTWQGNDPGNPTQWDNFQGTHNWSGTAPIGDTTEFFDNDVVNFTGNGQGTINISGTVSPSSMAVTAGNYSFTGGNIGGNGTLSVSGGANVTLSTGSNTFTGGVNITGSSIVNGNSSGALGTGPVSVTGSTLIVNNNGALSTAQLTLTSATLDNTSGSAVTNSSVTPITVGGNLTFVGTNGDLSLGTGTVTLTSSPTITVSNGNFTLGGNVIGGTNGITKSGSGSLIITGSSGAYSGGVVINAGSVQVSGASGSTGLGSGNTTVNANGTLIGTGTDAFGFTAGFSPTSIFINGGTVTDLPGGYRVTLQDIHFTAGGTLTSDPGNGGNGTQGQYSMNTGTVETDASSNQAVISAGCISLQHGNATFTVAQGTVPGGIDLLVSSSLVNFNTTAGAVIKTGPGSMELAGNNAYTGNTTVSQGTLILANSGTNNNVSSSPVLNVASGAKLDVSQITAGGGFVLANNGNQTLLNNGTVTGIVTANSNGIVTGNGVYGDIILNGGNLTAGSATAIGALTAGNLTVNSGSLQIKMSGPSADAFTLNGSTNLSNSNIAITVLTPVTPGSYVILTSPSALSNVTAGNLSGTGRVAYVVDAAALALNKLQIDVSGNPANLTWTSLDVNNNTQWDNTQSTNNWNRTDAGSGGNSTQFYDGDNVTFDNTAAQQSINISGSVSPGSTTVSSGNYSFNGGSINGAGGLTVNGGNLTINNSNNYTGATILNGGITTISSIGASGSGSPIGASGNAATNLVLNGATLVITGGGSTDRLFTLGANGATISSTGGTVTFSNTGSVGTSGSGNRTLTLDSGTSGSGGGILASILSDASSGVTSVNITGNGTWTLSGGNTYSGNTTVGPGSILKPIQSNSLGLATGGQVTILSGGTIDVGGCTSVDLLNFGSKVFHIAGNGNGTPGIGAITDTGVAQDAAFQNIVLDADASIGDNGTGSNGRIDDRGSPTTSLAAVLNLQGHTFAKVGTNQMSLVSTNIMNGNIDVQGGTLSLEVLTSTSGAGSITYEPNTISGFYANTVAASGNVTVPGLTWPIIYKGSNIIGSGCTGATVVGAPMVLEGNVTLEPIGTNAGSLTANNLLTLNGNITESGGSFNITKLGVNTTLFGGSGSTYSGGLFIQEGTIALSGNNALSPNSLVTLGNGGNSTVLDLAGFSTTIDGLTTDPSSTASAQTVTNSSATASTLTFITATSTFGGVIQNGPGTINLSVASGSLDLTGANTYSGNTSVNGGTLTVDSSGSITSNNISTSAGGTFTVVSGGTIPSTANLTNNGITNFNNPTRMINTLNGTTSGATVNLNTTILTVTTGGSYAGGISGTGGLIVPVGSVLTTGPINTNSLEVDGKQTFTNTTIRTLSKVNTLTVAGNTGNWTGALDLTSSRLVVEDSSGTRVADIATYKNMVANNVNGTAGIFSSTAAGNGQVVVVSDNAVRLATFGPAASNFGTGVGNVDANSILITEAVPGDANLDGVVDLKDLQVLATHWQQPTTDWSQTDFDGNGIVALPDLQALAIHWQNGVGAPGQGSGESFSEALAQFSLGGTSSVPEPMSLAILGLGGVALATRRRRAK